ncbi:PIN domain-containing protein [Arthrobacter sp. NPDC057259]|uniref:PIN domain-containing protein n=1 Tax=Arthrobacter sp. NPDC057259 TaxID=3346073 RepID=UPI00362FD5FC
MIRLLPGASPKKTLEIITHAAGALASVSSAGTAFDRYNSYLQWATRHGNILSHYLHADEMGRLVTTQRYWSLLSLDTSTVQPMTLAELVDGEVTQRSFGLDDAKRTIEGNLNCWDNGRAVAVVLDTNVWLKHYNDPAGDVDWSQLLDERPDVPLVLTVPMKVIDELDNLKRNKTTVPKGEVSIRRRASLALKYLEAKAAMPGKRSTLQQGTMAGQLPTATIHLAVLEQPLHQPPIADADLEIIERAGAVAPYAERVRIVTADYGMVYRARQAGLDAVRVKDHEEERNDQRSDLNSK